MATVKRASTYLSIKSKNHEDRPREKLILKGKQVLTKAELLGLIIGAGVEGVNAVDLAQQILSAYGNNLSLVAKLSIEELKTFKGIGNAKAALIMSALELAVRLQKDLQTNLTTITTSEDAYELMKPMLTSKVIEEFWLILVNSNSRIIKVSKISQGGLSRSIVDPRILFKHCLVANAVGMILVHNHPSGNLLPSPADLQMTQSIQKAADTLKFKLLDHIIFTDKHFFSFADEGLLNFDQP